MKNAFILSLLFVLFGTFSFAQNTVTDTSTTTVCYWKKGDTKILKIEQSKERIQKGKVKSKSSSSYEAHLKVLSESAKGYTIEWVYLNVGLGADENPIIGKMSKLSEGLKVIYTTDEAGAFVALKNWKKIRDFVIKGIDNIVKEMGNDPQLKAAFDVLKDVYQSKESIEQIVIKDIQLYHIPLGYEFILHEKIVSDTELPSLLAGDPVPANMTVELTELDPQNNYAKLVIEQRIDKDRGTAAIVEFLKKIMASMGTELPVDAIPLLEIYENNEFDLDLETGYVKRAYSERAVKCDMFEQIETMEITLVK